MSKFGLSINRVQVLARWMIIGHVFHLMRSEIKGISEIEYSRPSAYLGLSRYSSPTSMAIQRFRVFSNIHTFNPTRM